MRRRAFLAGAGAALLAAGCSSPAPAPKTTPRPKVTPGRPVSRFTFNDEFEGSAGSAPDPSKWFLGSNRNLSGGVQVYTDSRQTSFMDGKGHLVISAQPGGDGFTSARLTTLGKFSQLGGWFQARIKLDAGETGLWPAFWLIGQDINEVGWPWCGEVDILEDFGKRPPTVTSTVHVPNGMDGPGIPADSRTDFKYTVIPSNSDWHTYTVHWDLDARLFTFYRDGKEYFTTGIQDFNPAFWVYGPEQKNNGGMSIILNLAVGGFAGTPHPAHWPVQMYVDYVRVWQ